MPSAPRIEHKPEACVKARILAGYNVRQAALALDISAQHLTYVERKERQPSPALLKRMAELYGVEMESLFTLTESAA